MFRSITNNTAKNLSAGGTISGDVTIDGDLIVNGNPTGNYDEIINGNLVLSSGSKLGIGTGDADPSQPLHIKSATPSILFEDTTNGNLALIGDAQDFLTGDSPGADSFGIRSEGDIRLGTGGNNLRMTIDSSGNTTFAGVTTLQSNNGNASHTLLKIHNNDETGSGETGQTADIEFNFQGSTNGGVSYATKNAGAIRAGKDTDYHTSSADNMDSYLAFYTSQDNTNTLAMHIDSNQNIGIGTANPDSQFHLHGSTGIRLTDSNQNANEYAEIKFDNGGNTNLYINNDWTNSNALINFQLAGSTKMVVRGDGNVGIGETSPGEKLAVANGNIEAIMTTAGSGLRIIVDRVDTSDFAGFEARTGGNQKWFIGLRETSDENLHFYDPNGTAGDRLVLDSNSRISLSNNDSGVSNTIFGKDAGDSDGAGDYNVFVGEKAGGTGTQTDDADYNVGLGYWALTDLTNGESNVAVGAFALENNTSGGANVAIGSWDTSTFQAPLTTNQVGSFNIAIGSGALRLANDDSVDGSIGIGYGALNEHVGNSSNARFANTAIAIGYKALLQMSSGSGNLAIGYLSGLNVTTGANNLGIGEKTLGGNSSTALTGNDNISLGANAGRDMEGAAEGNVLVGKDSGISLTTGNFNVLIGRDAGDSLGAQTHNTAIGTDALGGSSLVDQTVIVGSQAATGAMTAAADGTVAIGYEALKVLTSGTGNLAIGYQAADAVSTGDHNTAIGYQALSTEDTGDRNTAIGYQALTNVNGANNNANTALGFQSGDSITTGTSNTCIGASTSTSANSAVNQTVVGFGTQGQQNNSVTLGNDDVTDVFMGSDSGALVNCSGIVFPASQVASGGANALDDYEEGEHTTAITGATSGSWTMDSAQTKLAYTKIGRMVTVVGKFETDSGSGSGTLKISLPFTSADLTAGAGITAGSITINRYGSTSIATQITPIVFEGTNYINVQYHNTDGTSNEGYIQADDIDGIFEGQLSITYFTD